MRFLFSAAMVIPMALHSLSAQAQTRTPEVEKFINQMNRAVDSNPSGMGGMPPADASQDHDLFKVIDGGVNLGPQGTGDPATVLLEEELTPPSRDVPADQGEENKASTSENRSQ